MKQLILASQSPRRNTILAQLGCSFGMLVADIGESVCDYESAKNYVLRSAQEKALVIFHILTPSQKSKDQK